MKTKKELILNLDDDQSFNQILKLLLKRLNYKLISTDNSKDFIDSLKENKDEIALCLIDINLNDQLGAGFQLIRAIRNKMGNDLLLYIISRRSDPADISYAFDIGANDYIQKPIDEEILKSKLQDIFNNKVELDQNFHYKKLTSVELELDIEFKIQKIDETGIVVSAKNNITRGTKVVIDHPFLHEATGKKEKYVLFLKEILSHGENEYIFYLEFDDNKGEIRASIRKWLLRHDTHTSKKQKSIVVKLPEDVMELIPEYIEIRKKDIIEFRKALEINDFNQIKAVSHMIAGNAGSFGFDDLGKFAKELENECESRKDKNKMLSLINTMDDYLSRLEIIEDKEG